jgi:L-threonylcarbamoyladenylate synthase
VNVSPERLAEAVEVLAQGGLVAFPTETVYGVGGLVTHEGAIERIFALKDRPRTRAIIVHIPSGDRIDDYTTETPESAHKLIEAFWPGPLTIVLKKAPFIPDSVTAGMDTVGLRVPKHPVPIALMEGLASRIDTPVGIAAPSACRFGEPPATTPEEVVQRLGTPGDAPETIDMLLDGGSTPGKLVSTMVSCVSDVPKLLRRGAVSVEDLEDVLGRHVDT